jgi:membrane protein implicated in regulation of membrane protease activity
MKVQEMITLLQGTKVQKMAEIGFGPFAITLLFSVLVSFFVSYLYSKFYGEKNTGSNVHRSFPLLGISITAIFISLQFSIPLSLGMLGALSIVRFRTPIKEPEEVGFILLVIALSLCIATFNFQFAAMILLLAVVALLGLARFKNVFRKSDEAGMLILHLPKEIYEELREKLFLALDQKIRGRLDSVTVNVDKTTINFEFKKLAMTEFQKISEEIQALHQQIEINVFYNRAGISF